MQSRKRSIPSKEEEVAVSEEEEEDEVLTMDGESIKRVGVIGARLQHIPPPTAGVRRRTTTTNDHMTKESMAATTAAKKDTRKIPAQPEGREMPYGTASQFKIKEEMNFPRKEKTIVGTTKLKTHNDSRGPPPSARR
jgi:hypothetical protein